jgi:hypothetical protein
MVGRSNGRTVGGTEQRFGGSSKSQGFRGGLRVVREWATRRRWAERADSGLTRTPSSRTIAPLMTVGRDRLSKAETATVTTIESGVPLLVEAREIIAAFQAMIRGRSLGDLRPWLERARTSLVTLRQWRHQRSSRRRRSDHVELVKWPNRRSDHQAQARQTTNVRPRETRSPPGSCRRAGVAQLHQKCVRALIPCRLTAIALRCAVCRSWESAWRAVWLRRRFRPLWRRRVRSDERSYEDNFWR